MGLSESAIVPARPAIINPRTGRPLGADDPYFTELNAELADKGFLVAAAGLRYELEVVLCVLGEISVYFHWVVLTNVPISPNTLR